MPTIIQDLYVQGGQSVWLDGYDKSWMVNGTLKGMVQNGLRGIIFDYQSMHVLLQDTDFYDKQIKTLYVPDQDPLELFNKLILDDIRSAADLFAPIYHVTRGVDGYVSVPIDPRHAYDAKNLFREGLSLFKTIRRPNIMFQAPATDEGFQAARELVVSGVNVHITHVISLEQYRRAYGAYISGLKELIATGALARTVTCFVGVQFDLIHQAFASYISSTESFGLALAECNGDLGLYTCRKIYEEFIQNNASEEFQELKQKGSHIQKLIWGPVSSRLKEMRDVKEIESMIANYTIAALDQASFEHFIEEGQLSEGFESKEIEAENIFEIMRNESVDCDGIFTKLLLDSIVFEQSAFTHLLNTLKYKKKS